MLQAIKKRCTKDNLWNLIFCFGTTAAVFLVESLIRHPDFPQEPYIKILLLLTAIVFPAFAVTTARKAAYIGKDSKGKHVFVNAAGDKLNDRLPRSFPKVLIFGLFLPMHICTFLPHSSNYFFYGITVFLALMPTVGYFLYLNCPIAILFNRKAWQPYVIAAPSPIIFHGSYMNDPAYAMYETNIYHHLRYPKSNF